MLLLLLLLQQVLLSTTQSRSIVIAATLRLPRHHAARPDHTRPRDRPDADEQPTCCLTSCKFKTNQRDTVARAGQPRWRLVICSDLGTVDETDLADSGDLSNGIWVREYDRRRDDHVGGKKKFFKFELISGIRMLQPSEFFLKTGAKHVRLQAGTKYHLPDFEDGTVNLWPEGEQGGFWLEAVGDTGASTEAAAACAAVFNAAMGTRDISDAGGGAAANAAAASAAAGGVSRRYMPEYGGWN